MPQASVVVERAPEVRGLTKPPVKGADVEITLERTCISVCSIYKVTIWGDGSVVFHGENTKVADATASIPPQSVAALAARIRAARFFDLEDRYTRKLVIGRASATTTVHLDGKWKRIEHYLDDDVLRKKEPKSPDLPPPALSSIEQAIDLAAGTARWIK